MKPFLFLFLFLGAVSSAFSSTIVEEILAQVGDEIITKSDYDSAMQRMDEELRRFYKGSDLEKQLADQKAQLLNFMINQKLLEQKAKELNINVEDEVNAA